MFGLVLLASVSIGTAREASPAQVPCSIESPTRGAASLATDAVCAVAAEVRANVDARNGGTLHLPDGTLVSLTPKALPENALVEVTEYAETAVGTPAPGFAFVGPSLRIAIEPPEPAASVISFSRIATTLPSNRDPVDIKDRSIDVMTNVFPAFPKIGAQIIYQLVQVAGPPSARNAGANK